jgi:hypothetical protein
MLKTISMVMVLAAITFASCKKDKEKTTQEKIVGRWKIESLVVNDMTSGTLTTNTYTGTAADFIEFRNDGTANTSVDGTTDNMAWGIISDAKVWMDSPSDIYDIKVLTDTKLVIYSKETYGADYYEVSINLKK